MLKSACGTNSFTILCCNCWCFSSNKLQVIPHSGMAEELRLQLENPNSDLESFQERFEKLVTAEWNLRYNKKFERYLKKAKLKIPGAAFDEKLYDPDRQLDIPTIE